MATAAITTAESGAAKHRQRLKIMLGLTGSYMVVEVIAGLLTGSLALVADAGDMLTDVFGLSVALFAIWFAGRPATPERTFGYYRSEILAAMANATVLFFLSAYILYEAWHRFQSPPDVNSGPMMLVGVGGLIVNVVGVWLLREGSAESLNVKGAYLEAMSDMLGSIGVIVAGAIIFFTGWNYADPLFSVLAGLFIIPRTWKLLRDALSILMEGTPSYIKLPELEKDMLSVPGVLKVEQLHVWSLTSGVEAMNAHVIIADEKEDARILRDLTGLLQDKYSIDHTALQIEPGRFPEERS